MSFSFRQLTFQSFGSVDPALNFVALLPLMAIFSGSMMSVATSISFMISFLSFLPTIIFSSKNTDGAGYPSYVLHSLGLRLSVFTGIIYILYSFLVIPNILMFSSFFVQSYYFTHVKIEFDLLFSLILLLVLAYPVARSQRITIRTVTMIGILETIGIIILSILMVSITQDRVVNYNFSSILTGNFWEAVMIGVLMFSGSGSGIFLFNQADQGMGKARKSLLVAYVLTGAVMILASVSLTMFLGKMIGPYSSNPSILLNIMESRFGPVIPILIVALLLFSAYNLMLSYSNALTNMYSNYQTKILKLAKPKPRNYFFAGLLLVDVFILLLSRETMGFYNAFIIIAETVSMTYVIVHVMVGLALFGSHEHLKRARVMGLVSLLFLCAALAGSILNSTSLFEISLILFIVLILMGFLISIYIHTHRNGKVEFME